MMLDVKSKTWLLILERLAELQKYDTYTEFWAEPTGGDFWGEVFGRATDGVVCQMAVVFHDGKVA